MALPQLAGAGASVPMLKDAFSQQDEHGDSLASLVDLTKDLVDGQAKLFQKLLLVLDAKKENTDGDLASGSVEGDVDEEEMTLGVKDLFLGAVTALTLWANELDTYIRTIFLAKALNNLTGLSTKLANVFKAIGDVWSKKATGQFLKGDTYKTLGKLTAPIRAIGDFFGRILKFLKPVTDTVKGVGSTIGDVIKSIGNFIKMVIAPFTGLGKLFGPVLKAAAPLISMAKAIPFFGQIIAVLFGVFDFISGFITGFKEGGLIEGFKEGFMELIRGAITKPLDMIKDVVSWAVKKMGFDNFSEILDNFSFTDLFNRMVTKIGEMIDGIADWFGTLFTDPVQALKDVLQLNADIAQVIIDTIGDMLTSALDWIGEFFNIDTTLLGGEEGESLGTFISRKIDEIIKKVRAFIAEFLTFDSIKNRLGFGDDKSKEDEEKRTKLNMELKEAEEEARTGTVIFGSDEKYRAEKAEEAEEIRKQLAEMNKTSPASLTPNTGLQPEGAQLSDATKEVAVKKEQNQGQAAPVVIQAGNGDTNNYGGGTTILGPSEKSNYADNWAYS